MNAKKLWKVVDSNARSAIKNGKEMPQRIFPYVSIENVSIENKDYQEYLNSWARFALEFRGGVWKE